MKRVLTIFGMRPEGIKLAPIILELDKHLDHFENLICITGQHREMFDQVLDWFEIQPDFGLNLMQPNQELDEFAGTGFMEVSKAWRKCILRLCWSKETPQL